MRSVYVCLAVLSTALLLGACAPRIKVPGEPPVPVEPAVSGDALMEKGNGLIEAAAWEQALAAFEAYLSRFPDGPRADEALLRMGAVHTVLKRYEDARTLYGHLIDRFPYSSLVPDAQIGILNAYYEEGKYESVLRAFDAMGSGAFSRAQARMVYQLVGDAHWIIGNAQDAVIYYTKAWELAPKAERAALQVKIAEALRLVSPPDIERLILHPDLAAAASLLAELAKPFRYNRFSLGCLLPLSGRYANYGAQALKGIELALSRYTQKPGAPDFRIVIKDTAGDAEVASRALRELVDNDQVAAVIGSLVTAETAALEAQMAQIPIITLTQKDQITEIGDFVFRNFFTPRMQVDTLVTFCSRQLGLSRYAILYPDEPYGHRFMNSFWDAVIESGGTVVGAEAYGREVTDFADPIKKLVGLYYELPEDLKQLRHAPDGGGPLPGAGFDSMLLGPSGDRERNLLRDRLGQPAAGEPSGNPEEPQPMVDFDAVFIPDSPSKAGLIIPQLAYYDVRDVYLLGTNLWYSPKLVEMTRQYAQNALMPVGFFADSASGPVKSFVDQFRRVYGETPDFMEAVAFDTATLLMNAAGLPHVRSRAALRDALFHTDLPDGVTGSTRFDNLGNAQKSLRVIRVKGDRFVELPAGNPS